MHLSHRRRTSALAVGMLRDLEKKTRLGWLLRRSTRGTAASSGRATTASPGASRSWSAPFFFRNKECLGARRRRTPRGPAVDLKGCLKERLRRGPLVRCRPSGFGSSPSAFRRRRAPKIRLKIEPTEGLAQLVAHVRRHAYAHVVFFQHLGACRRPTPRTCVDPKVSKDVQPRPFRRPPPIRSCPRRSPSACPERPSKKKSAHALRAAGGYVSGTRSSGSPITGP